MVTLKERVRLYLEARKSPVSREELKNVSTRNGVNVASLNKVLRDLQDVKDNEDVDILSWWGYKDDSEPLKNEEKTLWLSFYKMGEEEKQIAIESLDWFDSL